MSNVGSDSMFPTTRQMCQQWDAQDPLAPVRSRFVLPDGMIYLDGNSLGPPTVDSAQALHDFATDQWAAHLIGGWRSDGWMDAPVRLGAAVAHYIGADADEVAVADSTTINLYKMVHAALRLRPDRRVLVAADEDFPTDTYVIDSIASQVGAVVRRCDPQSMASLDFSDVAAVVCSHVHFRTGVVNDLAGITAAAHAGGAVAVWDLSHSAGALAVTVNTDRVDLAVGCTYKYLNGGPGSPAYCFVARRHHADLSQPITGWLGHADPFAFEASYRPASGVQRLVTGTPSVASLVALERGLAATADVDIHQSRSKAVALTQLFIEVLQGNTSAGPSNSLLSLVSPGDPHKRGNHVSFAHPNAYAIVQALIARGVIGDFRAPDVMRFGFAPAYLRFVDAFDAATHLNEVLASNEWRHPQFQVRDAVT